MNSRKLIFSLASVLILSLNACGSGGTEGSNPFIEPKSLNTPLQADPNNGMDENIPNMGDEIDDGDGPSSTSAGNPQFFSLDKHQAKIIYAEDNQAQVTIKRQFIINSEELPLEGFSIELYQDDQLLTVYDNRDFDDVYLVNDSLELESESPVEVRVTSQNTDQEERMYIDSVRFPKRFQFQSCTQHSDCQRGYQCAGNLCIEALDIQEMDNDWKKNIMTQPLMPRGIDLKRFIDHD